MYAYSWFKKMINTEFSYLRFKEESLGASLTHHDSFTLGDHGLGEAQGRGEAVSGTDALWASEGLGRGEGGWRARLAQQV